MKILVTGGAGYLGCVLVPKLLLRGHQVRVVDIGYFGLDPVRNLRRPPEVIREDLRRSLTDPAFTARLLEGIDCVIHLAAISNDPSAELYPELTHETNYRVTMALAEAAKDRKIRFIFSSSCSVYGEAAGQLDESGATCPLTAYAISKVDSENSLTELAGGQWQPVILRNGTLFGYSPRMRFDLVANIFSLYSTLYHEVKVFGDGLQWRPFLHVSDCARAFLFFAERPEVRHSFYNVAQQNLRVADLASLFCELQPGLTVTHVPTADVDVRNYSVTAQRLLEEGFTPKVDLRSGAEEMMEAILCGRIPDPESAFYRNAKWLKDLTQLGAADHAQIVALMERYSAVRHAGYA